jgi:predicted metal-dependent peptidase
MKKELKGSLSDEKLAELKKKISESLALDRHGLIFDFPFTASLMMRLDLIPTRDKRNMTACTDGKSIYFDCDFYTRLSKKERAFVLAHEVWHNVLLHLSRKQTRDAQLFNIATDMEVNHLLASEAAGKSIEPPEGLLFPPKNLEGKSAEVIYDYLLKQAKKEAKKAEKQALQMPGMPSAGSGGSGENDSADENESECESQEEESAGSGNQSGKQKQKKDSKQKGSGSDGDVEENEDNTANKHRRDNKKR